MNKYQTAMNVVRERPKISGFSSQNTDDLFLGILQELVEKATPKKVIKLPKTKYGYMHICPICNNYIGTIVYDTSARIIVEIEHDDYCCSCGQALDWSDEDE